MTGSSSEEIAENVAEIVTDELGKEYGNGSEKLPLAPSIILAFLILGTLFMIADMIF